MWLPREAAEASDGHSDGLFLHAVRCPPIRSGGFETFCLLSVKLVRPVLESVRSRSRQTASPWVSEPQLTHSLNTATSSETTSRESGSRLDNLVSDTDQQRRSRRPVRASPDTGFHILRSDTAPAG